MLTEDLGTGRFRVLEDTEYDMGITRKRHGGILSITDEEYERLAEAYESQAPGPGGGAYFILKQIQAFTQSPIHSPVV